MTELRTFYSKVNRSTYCDRADVLKINYNM